MTIGALAMDTCQRTLQQLEAAVERGQQAAIEVSEALEEIRERRLYVVRGYERFDDYCRDRFGMSRQRTEQLRNFAQVGRLLATNVAEGGLNMSNLRESQARELTPLLRQDEAAVVEVWNGLCAKYAGHITAEKVREAVEAKLAPICPPRDLQEITQGIQERPHVSFNAGNNQWYTPPEYIVAARRVLGAIDLDPASSDIANRCVKATRYYTAENDGLVQPWTGRVWMNPPYAAELIGKFADKLVQHFAAGEVTTAIVLVNNATETNWFQGLLGQSSAVCFPRQRVRFLDPSGNPGAPLQGQAVLYFGDNAGDFAREFGAFGKVLFG